MFSDEKCTIFQSAGADKEGSCQHHNGGSPFKVTSTKDGALTQLFGNNDCTEPRQNIIIPFNATGCTPGGFRFVDRYVRAFAVNYNSTTVNPTAYPSTTRTTSSPARTNTRVSSAWGLVASLPIALVLSVVALF